KKVESGEIGEIDVDRLFRLIERLGEVEYEPKKKLEKIYVDETEIAIKMVCLRKEIIEQMPQELGQLLKLIEEKFGDTGYKLPKDKNGSMGVAMAVGVTREDLQYSIPLTMDDAGYVIVIKMLTHQVIVFRVGPTGQRIPVAF
ncbi:hypothetical protein ACFL3T_04525, partial [Patescibacteria group bacterium]